MIFWFCSFPFLVSYAHSDVFQRDEPKPLERRRLRPGKHLHDRPRLGHLTVADLRRRIIEVSLAAPDKTMPEQGEVGRRSHGLLPRPYCCITKPS